VGLYLLWKIENDHDKTIVDVYGEDSKKAIPRHIYK
jgi:hypothetical protein